MKFQLGKGGRWPLWKGRGREDAGSYQRSAAGEAASLKTPSWALENLPNHYSERAACQRERGTLRADPSRLTCHTTPCPRRRGTPCTTPSSRKRGRKRVPSRRPVTKAPPASREGQLCPGAVLQAGSKNRQQFRCAHHLEAAPGRKTTRKTSPCSQ